MKISKDNVKRGIGRKKSYVLKEPFKFPHHYESLNSAKSTQGKRLVRVKSESTYSLGHLTRVESKEKLIKKSQSSSYLAQKKIMSVEEKYSNLDAEYAKLRKKFVNHSIMENNLERIVKMTKSTSSPNLFKKGLDLDKETKDYKRKKLEERLDSDYSVSHELNPFLENKRSIDLEKFYFNPKCRRENISKFLVKSNMSDKTYYSDWYNENELSKKIERMKSDIRKLNEKHKLNMERFRIDFADVDKTRKEELYLEYLTEKEKKMKQINEKKVQLSELIFSLTEKYENSIKLEDHNKAINQMMLYYKIKKENLLKRINKHITTLEKAHKDFDMPEDIFSERVVPETKFEVNMLQEHVNESPPRHNQFLISFQNNSPEQNIKVLNTKNYRKTESEMIKSFYHEDDQNISLEPEINITVKSFKENFNSAVNK